MFVLFSVPIYGACLRNLHTCIFHALMIYKLMVDFGFCTGNLLRSGTSEDISPWQGCILDLQLCQTRGEMTNHALLLPLCYIITLL